MNRKVALLMLPIAFFSATAESQATIDADSRRLARCGGIFAYAANWAMLQEKPNTARLMVFQQSRALSYAMALNYQNGGVTGDKKAEFSAEIQKSKIQLDSDQAAIPGQVDRCVTDTNRIEEARIDRSMVMWGMRLPQLIDQTAASLRRTLGI